MNETPDTDTDLRRELNAQTGRLSWAELAPFFARGVVIRVAPELDLVEIAVAFAKDDKHRVETWISEGSIAGADVPDAKRWEAEQAEFWAVVVAPWVLAQHIEKLN